MMNVTMIFHQHYEGDLSGAVWIVDSPFNKRRFEGNSNLDQNSAVFYLNNDNALHSNLNQLVWSVKDHYPKMTTLTVIGLDYVFARYIEEECETVATDTGFTCRFTTSF